MYEYRVKKVLKIVDGDTIDVDIDLGFDISYTQRVRLAGIDTPESRTKDAREKVLGLEVKDRLKKAIDAATDVIIVTEKPDSTEKYGAFWAGYIWTNLPSQSTNCSLKKAMLGHTWAKPKSKTLMPSLPSATKNN